MPKIQARIIKSMLKKGEAHATFLESLSVKLSLEGFNFKMEQDERSFLIRISDCSWHNLMVKSGREKFSEAVGTTMCAVEYSVWISEFNENIDFTFEKQKCKGSEYCILNFRKR